MIPTFTGSKGSVTFAKTLPMRFSKLELVDTNLGRKIVLLQWQDAAGWWTRAFDAE